MSIAPINPQIPSVKINIKVYTNLNQPYEYCAIS